MSNKNKWIIFMAIITICTFSLVSGIVKANIRDMAVIGEVVSLKGDVYGNYGKFKSAVLTKREIKPGEKIHADCTITTGDNSYVEIKLVPELAYGDDFKSRLILRSNSKAAIITDYMAIEGVFNDLRLEGQVQEKDWKEWYRNTSLIEIVEDSKISLSFSRGNIEGDFASGAVKYFDVIDYAEMVINLQEGSDAEFSIKQKDTAVIGQDFQWYELTAYYQTSLDLYGNGKSYDELDKEEKFLIDMNLKNTGMISQLKKAEPSMLVLMINKGQVMVNTKKGLNPVPEQNYTVGERIKYLYGWEPDYDEMETATKESLPGFFNQAQNIESDNMSKESKNPSGMPLDLDITVIRERADLSEAMEAQMKSIAARSMAEQGAGMSPDMFRFEVWVYEIKEKVESALENQHWSGQVQKTPLERMTIDKSINDAINNPEVDFDKLFGAGWSDRAKAAAREYQGIEYSYKSYTVPNDMMGSYTATVMSPCFNIESLKLEETTILSITKISINMGSIGMPGGMDF